MITTPMDVLEFVRKRDTARRNHTDPRCYGVSSDALAAYALGWGPRPTIPGRPESRSVYGTHWMNDQVGNDYPHDQYDLAACELTYEMAPTPLQERMLPVLEEFRRWINDGLNRFGEKVRP